MTFAVAPANRADTLTLYVRFPPSWAHIDPLRQYVDVWVRAKARGATADRASMVVHELLENAVKYGDPTSEVEIEIHSAHLGFGLEVRVSNKAHPSRVAILDREYQKIRGDSSRDAFNRALQRLQRLPEGTTMLGLARIATESALNVEIVGDRVSITAKVVDSSASGAFRK